MSPHSLCPITRRMALDAVLLTFSAITPAANDIDISIDRFEIDMGITAWPRLDLCGYDRPFVNTALGVWLRVSASGHAKARWDGRCNVPAKHVLGVFHETV